MLYVLEWSSSHTAGSNLSFVSQCIVRASWSIIMDKDEEHFVFAVWLVKLLTQVNYIKTVSDQKLKMFTYMQLYAWYGNS